MRREREVERDEDHTEQGGCERYRRAGGDARRAPAASGAVVCGSAIHQDTKLKQNLLCDPGTDAITFDGSNIKLDLNGHTISGQGAGGRGVVIGGGSGASVVNGKIRGFDNGVYAFSTHDLTLRKLNIKDAANASVFLDHVVKGTVTKNALLGRDLGAAPNLTALGISRQVEVLDNRVVGGSIDFNGGNHFTATGNDVSSSPAQGIVVGDAANTTVRENHVSQTETGGISLSGASVDTRVDGNTVEKAGGGGIVSSTGATGALVTRNTVLDVNFNGFFVASGTDEVLRNNVAKRSQGGDGIHVEDTDTLIVNNRLIRNDQNAIESSSSNGSGNIAKHNGVHPQCIPQSLCA